MLETQTPVTDSRLRAFSGRRTLWPMVLLIGYVAAGIIVTWPLATYLGGPAARYGCGPAGTQPSSTTYGRLVHK